MKESRTKNALYNIIFAIILQLITALSGLILPRLIIPKYGSDVNGLIISITQFLSYIALLEAGAESVFRSALYDPFAKKDYLKVSKIFNSSKKFFKKIAIILLLYIFVLCIIFPTLIAQNHDFVFTILMVLILSGSTFFQYYISIPYISVLSASQKVRIVYFIDTVLIILNLIFSYILITLNANILIVKLVSTLLFIVKPVFFIYYVKKKFDICNTNETDEIVAKNQKYGFIHHLAQFIHVNTDIIIITFLMGTKDVSIYAVYYAIVSGIERIISSLSVGSAAGIGDLLSENDVEKSNKLVDKFEFIQGGLTTVLYSITALMLIPFIKLYTVNMTDADYVNPNFGYILVAANVMYCFRLIYTTITLNGNKFKDTFFGAIFECLINVCISIVLVWKLGLIGVAIGTLIGMVVRYLFDVIYLSKNLLFRNCLKPLKFLLISFVSSAISISVCVFIVDKIFVLTWTSWLIAAFCCSIITSIICGLIYLIFYYKTISELLIFIKKIIFKK